LKKKKLNELREIAELKYLRTSSDFKSCNQEIARIREKISHIHSLGKMSSFSNKPLQDQIVSSAWTSWKMIRISGLNLDLSTANASLEKHKRRTAIDFGRSNAHQEMCRRILKR